MDSSLLGQAGIGRHDARMLRTALGLAISAYLEDPGVVEVKQQKAQT
jgi:hypothetical protein